MKVKLMTTSRHSFTLEELRAALQVIDACSQDEAKAKDYAKFAAKALTGKKHVRIMEAQAEVDKHNGVWDALGAETHEMDVWISFTAITDDEIVLGGAYLTDIWEIDEENAKEITKRMYVRRFVEVKGDGHAG